VSVTDAVGLLTEYERWSSEKVNRDQDLSPQAFLAERRERRAVDAIEACLELAVGAALTLRAAIAAADVGADLIPALENALAVCDKVVEAGQWE
jgi:hypothetical protein